ncbi:MAG: hypothetical protein ACOZIN_21190 [Myxococcota bacterium]
MKSFKWQTAASVAGILALGLVCIWSAAKMIFSLTGDWPRDGDADPSANRLADWLWGPVSLGLMLAAFAAWALFARALRRARVRTGKQPSD